MCRTSDDACPSATYTAPAASAWFSFAKACKLNLGDLLEALGFAGRPIAVEVDGAVVPRAAAAGHRLVGGERIEIVTFVGGG